MIRTPSQYLRRIDPRFAARVIDYGLSFLSSREDHALYLQKVSLEGALPWRLRAVTSPKFGRIYDHDVVEMVQEHVDTDVWKCPTHDESGNPESTEGTTLYASDRDVSIFLTDDRNPIEIKVDGQEEVLQRGFVVRNSEVGTSRFELLTFFYRYTCQNRLLWTPRSVKQLGITHASGAPKRFQIEAHKMLQGFTNADVSEVRERVERAMRLKVGREKIGVTEWLQKAGFGKGEAGRIFDRAEQEEGKARTLWDVIQGGTSLARTMQHTDTRLEQETRIGHLLDRCAA